MSTPPYSFILPVPHMYVHDPTFRTSYYVPGLELVAHRVTLGSTSMEGDIPVSTHPLFIPTLLRGIQSTSAKGVSHTDTAVLKVRNIRIRIDIQEQVIRI